MALFIAYNSALSATTAIAAGTSYSTGAKVGLQLQVPDNGKIKLVEWGISMDGSAAATPALCEVATTDTATTSMTAHSATTIESLDLYGVDSRLTMGTGGTAYGAVAITSNTTLRPLDRQYVAPTSQYVKMWPLGREPVIGSGSAENFLQFRINTTATVNAIIYAVWEEHIG
ncbi:hypothetical protein [Streptomyces sp. NPDC001774]